MCMTNACRLASWLGAALCAGIGLMVGGTASAADIWVTKTDTQPGACSLEQAIQSVNTRTSVGGCAAANGNADNIWLPAGTMSISTQLAITQGVTIGGGGQDVSFIRAATYGSGLVVKAGPTVFVQLNYLTLMQDNPTGPSWLVTPGFQ